MKSLYKHIYVSEYSKKSNRGRKVREQHGFPHPLHKRTKQTRTMSRRRIYERDLTQPPSESETHLREPQKHTTSPTAASPLTP